MIKSYSEITGKYLRINKKRTALTIIGIVLSVALISSIGLFLKSMQAAELIDVKNTYGSFHIMFNNFDESLTLKIKSNPNVLQSGIYGIGREEAINGNLYVREVYGTSDALKLMPYRLKEGRFPERPGEVAMEAWFISKIQNGTKTGDTIKILDKEYTLVGILDNTYSSQYEGIGELLLKDDSAEINDKVLLVQLKPGRNLEKYAEELKKLAIDEKNVSVNDYLIMMEGRGIPENLLGILVFVISIVVISTIAVIYNSFQISVVERVRQFGLLRAVGSTPRQIRRIILREAAFVSAAGIPIGLLCGIAALYGIYFSFRLIGGDGVFSIYPVISIDVMIISTVVGLISVYISALIPAIFASRISPLAAISSRNSITREKIKRKSSFVISKLLGFEGGLAAKNIKRNRKRYRTTVFSIILSVTLFITFKAFMDLSLNVYDDINESKNIHFSIYSSGSTSMIGEEIIESISKLPQVESVYKVYGINNFYAAIDKEKEIDEIKIMGNLYDNVHHEGKDMTLLNSSLEIYDENSLEASKSYLKEGKINIDELNSVNGVIIIAKNVFRNANTKNKYYGPIANLKVGDEIILQSSEFNGSEDVKFGEGEVKKARVLALYESDPFNFRGSDLDIKMITTKAVAEKLTGKEQNPTSLRVKLKDVKLEETAAAGIDKIISSNGDLRLINIIAQNRNDKSTELMIKILLYGFVIVVSLIGSVNIINTLTTNIILRRREFAALKSIGLTQKGLKKMITLEGMMYGIMGSIYGSILGSLFSYLLYRGINDVREQRYSLPFEAIIIAVSGAMLIGYLSVLSPLKRIKKENLIDTVREDF